jgi:ribosomal protein S18 acetylase RimI-like enzyme
MTTEIRLATIRHVEELLPLVRAFHGLEGVVQDDQTRRSALASLLMAPELGSVWRIYHAGKLTGYIAICLGYSIEFGGKDGFVDEFFLVEASRGRGIGRAALNLVVAELVSADVKALHLEVAQSNRRAQELYASAGFKLREKYHLMSRRFDALE